MGIEILNGGLHTTIQDFGRPEGGPYGIPWSGFMDRASAFRANLIVGNYQSAALLETTIIGPKIKFNDTHLLAICGADQSPRLNNQQIQNDILYSVKQGDILSFGNCKTGCHAYIAIQGIIDVPLVYGSKSTYTYASLGGYRGRALHKGDNLNITPSTISNYEELPITSFSHEIEIIKGPEFDYFEDSEIDILLKNEYTITQDSNRMGYRFDGKSILNQDKESIISSGTIRGTIQIPNSGTPMVLMADSPTTGGYPRPAVCTEAGVNQLAQKKPGDKIRFYLK